MEKQKRHSRKRDAILEEIRKTKEHPSAERIYAKLKRKYPDLSLGTIYRNISEFQQTGEVVCVSYVNGTARYDADTAPHPHFICSVCGSVEDIALKLDDELIERAKAATDARIEGVCLSFGGLCSKCASNTNLSAQ